MFMDGIKKAISPNHFINLMQFQWKNTIIQIKFHKNLEVINAYKIKRAKNN